MRRRRGRSSTSGPDRGSHVAILFVPSLDYGCPASPACRHFLVKQYCITLVELARLVELVKQYCITLVELVELVTLIELVLHMVICIGNVIWLLLFETSCVLFVWQFKYWFKYEEYEPDRWDPLI